jgi:UDP-N-acetylmuramate dehydrogenase
MVIDFSRYSSIKIGPVVEVKEITPENFEGEYLIGRATNTLISPTPPPLGVLSREFDFIRLDGDLLRVGGSVKNRHLYNFARKHNLGGFEFLRNLPGSVGGSLKMNAGVKEWEISKNLVALKGYDGWHDRKEFQFSYRSSTIETPIFEAIFKITHPYRREIDNHIRQLRKNQPKGASLGSVFKNPPGDYAGRLIEKVGLKGYRIGGVEISPIHANFFINVGGGTFSDMMKLIELAQSRVMKHFGVQLELEIKIV